MTAGHVSGDSGAPRGRAGVYDAGNDVLGPGPLGLTTLDA